MSTKSATIPSISSVLLEQWEQAGRKLAALAEEFPQDRFDWKPADGVRTVGDVVRHAAFWNCYAAATIAGEKADDQANELPKAEFPTKAKAVEALRSSVADVSAALGRVNPQSDAKVAETAMAFLAHIAEHYGQLAIYARLSGIVPPASR